MPLNDIATAAFRATGASASIQGPSALESEFLGTRRKVVRPCSDDFDVFLRLDSPRDVDDDGVRTVPAADVSTIVAELDHPGSPRTFSGDGAWLECANVSIPAGASLRFSWGFLRFDGFPGNDFCAFQAGQDEPEVLCQVIDLENEGNANQTSGKGGGVWKEHVWPAPNGFQGTLRWIVANGQIILNPSGQQPTQRRFAFPSALVLCGLDIV